jgi:hypothetical protein
MVALCAVVVAGRVFFLFAEQRKMNVPLRVFAEVGQQFFQASGGAIDIFIQIPRRSFSLPNVPLPLLMSASICVRVPMDLLALRQRLAQFQRVKRIGKRTGFRQQRFDLLFRFRPATPTGCRGSSSVSLMPSRFSPMVSCRVPVVA